MFKAQKKAFQLILSQNAYCGNICLQDIFDIDTFSNKCVASDCLIA